MKAKKKVTQTQTYACAYTLHTLLSVCGYSVLAKALFPQVMMADHPLTLNVTALPIHVFMEFTAWTLKLGTNVDHVLPVTMATGLLAEG